jgi:ferrochelatase
MQTDLLYVMYMGGPEDLNSIEPFLKNLFSDREIIDFKIGDFLQEKLASVIAKKRSVKVAPEYEKIGGKSPQIHYLRLLLEKVKEIYEMKNNVKLETEMGMCYYHPYIEETSDIFLKDNYENIFIMTMYPQYSYSTSGVCFKRLFDEFYIKPSKKPFKVIPYWHLNRKYNECIIVRILNAADKLGKSLKDCYLLFSAHSLPVYTVERGDVYTKHLEEQINFIVDKLDVKDFSLAYQSRTGPIKWLGPETSEVLKDLAEKNIEPVIVIPISFVSDHIETLIELDEQYIPDFSKKGLQILRIESLNAAIDFANAIVDIMRH